MERAEGRSPVSLRPVRIIEGVSRYAESSAEVSFGNTRVLTTVTIEREVPRWMQPGSGGWITAEYAMLPRATHSRNPREAVSGKQSGRTQEIQRLIGRSLRAAVDLSLLPAVTLRFDCDVLCADGGTRTAAITGCWVALVRAVEWLRTEGLLTEAIPLKQIAAVSVGSVNGMLLTDLDYAEDSQAEFDLNIVGNSAGEIVELQGTAERRSLRKEEVLQLLALGERSLGELFQAQRGVLASCGVVSWKF